MAIAGSPRLPPYCVPDLNCRFAFTALPGARPKVSRGRSWSLEKRICTAMGTQIRIGEGNCLKGPPNLPFRV